MAHKRINVEKTARRIATALDALSESQAEIGARLRLDQSRISRYRRADFTRYSAGVRKLCEYLRIKPQFVSVSFNPSRHRALVNALQSALSGDSRDEKAITALLRAAARMRRLKSGN
jgi:hypothetical protein